jgi:hypothetical protein
MSYKHQRKRQGLGTDLNIKQKGLKKARQNKDYDRKGVGLLPGTHPNLLLVVD